MIRIDEISILPTVAQQQYSTIPIIGKLDHLATGRRITIYRNFAGRNCHVIVDGTEVGFYANSRKSLK